MYLTEIFFKEDTKFMKLSKSHILLISLISIFLLLSVSAVSAADDMDNQVLSDNSGADLSIDEISGMDNNVKDTRKLSQAEETDIYADEGDDGGDSQDEEPADTTIESENKTLKYGEDIKIPVSVKDNESNAVTIAKDNLKVSNGADEIDFSLDNESNIVLSQLNVGEYILNISFIGNATYKASETAVNLTIAQSETEIVVDDTKVKYGSDINVPIVIKDEFNNTITFKKSDLKVFNGEEEIEFSIKNSTLILSNITDIGNYNIVIKYLGNENYIASEKTITVSILANNTIKANDTIKVNNHTQNVTIPIVIVNTNVTTAYNEETGKNETTTTVTNLTVTKEDLIVLLTYFNGTENITEVITDYDLTGEPGNYTINFTTDKLDHSELFIVYANETENETNKTITLIGYLNAKIIPITVVADYQNGNFTFKLVDADYEDEDHVLANTTITVRGVNFYKFDNGTSISPSKQFTSDENGIIFIDNVNLNTGYDFSSFIYNFTCLSAGKYNLTFKGNDSLDLDKTIEITINKVNVKIVASNYKQVLGSGVKYTFKLVNANTNQAIKLTPMQFKVKIGSNYTTFNTTTNMSGQCSFNVNLVPATYPAIIQTNSANVVKATKNVNLTILKKPGVLTASNRTILYGSGATAIIRFTDKNTGKAIVNGIVKVRLYTTSTKYVDLAFRTNKTGHVKFNAALTVGKHKMVISSLDTNYTATSITRYVTIKKTSGKFTAPKISTYYRSGRIYTVKLINANNKNPMYGAKVNIKVFISKNRYYNYTGVTDGNGKVNLKVSYKPGTYKVVVGSADKGYTAKSVNGQIKVAKHPIKMNPTSLKVKKGTNFKVKVISSKTKKVLSNVKVKVKVYTGKKYKTYTIKTNSKGIASLKISQKVGKHKVVLSPGSPTYYSAKALTKTLTVTK